MEIRQIPTCPPHYCPDCDGVVHFEVDANGLVPAWCAGSLIVPPRGAGGQTAPLLTDPCGWSAQYTKEPTP